MIKKILLALLIIVLLAAVFITYKAINFQSRQIQVAPIEKRDISENAVTNYSEALQIKTVSPEDPADFDSTEFRRFNQFLKTTYPLTDSLLEKKVFNEFSWLYKWQGSDQSLKPLLFMGHIDVVPVIEENIPDWDEDPFGGAIKDGIIWGRGAIDDKISVIGLLEASEVLLSEGFTPKRTIYFAYGHDEEIGGVNGAQVISKYLEDQGVELDFVMDEGGAITQDILQDVSKDVAMVGISEKGFLTLTLSVKIEGGHSSMPAKETAIDVMASAIARLKQNPFPAKLSETTRHMFSFLGPEMPFTNKIALANLGIFESAVINNFTSLASGNASVRTTTSPTIFNSGVKDNVIPQFATAKVNFRILPGETTESVLERVRTVVDDERINLEPSKMFSTQPSDVSGIDSWGFNTIHKTIKEIFPEVIVAPNLVVGGTDSRYYRNLTPDIYRFNPININPGNLKSFHGLNERLPVSEYKDAIRFYIRLIENSSL